MSRSFYLTTAIYYANAQPHIGHAYEIIAADVIARFNRLIGKQVYFLTGTDEHGIKVEKTALKHGMLPKQYVDQISDDFKQAWDKLNITYDRFIRTTESSHYETVSVIWKHLVAQGDIYRSSYTGQYCSGCEAFLSERDLTEAGLCVHHLVQPEAITEENYFFRLSKYRDRIKAHLTENPTFILPEFRKNEVLSQLDDLQDISVSRSKQSVSWGIPVPGDPDQVIYVWIDALSNYLTGIGWPEELSQVETYWPPQVQVIGKDILRFHGIYWPALLMALELPLPQTLLVHGFITVSETKISKTLGNVIGCDDLMERFSLDSVDPIRYYMMASAHFGQDGNYSDDDFKARINADLANNLGNLLNRTLNMSNKYFEGKVPAPDKQVLTLLSLDALNQIRERYENYQFSEALSHIMTLVDQANKYINDQEPWSLHKQGKQQELANVIYTILESLRQVAILLSPVIPTLSQLIWQQLGYDNDLIELDWRLICGGSIPVGQTLVLGDPLLPRLDSEIVGSGKKK